MPGPKGLPLIGSFPHVFRDPLGFFEAGVQRYGSAIRYRMGPFRVLQLQDPDDVRHVLVKNPGNYRKSPTYQVLREVLGNGLVTSEGSFWRKQRRLAQPAFHHQRLEGFAATMAELTRDLIERWEARPGDVDLHQAMTRLTLRIVGHTLMSTELDDQAEAIGGWVEALLDYASHPESLMFFPLWLPLPKRVMARRAIRKVDGVIYSMIRRRRASGELGDDLLGMLMAATDADTQETMTPRQLRDELVTLMLAGHETTANALSWTWYLLGQHPRVASRVRGEIDRVLGDRSPGLADLKQLRYTEAVIKESMRIYPPVWMIERQAVEADTIGDIAIEPGTLVGICPWTLHRDPRWFPEPEVFDPERFLNEDSGARHRYAYLPFGGGPRTCIGNSFAMMEATLIVAMLARRFDIDISPAQTITPKPGVTLRPNPGIRATIRRRPHG